MSVISNQLNDNIHRCRSYPTGDYPTGDHPAEYYLSGGYPTGDYLVGACPTGDYTIGGYPTSTVRCPIGRYLTTCYLT